MTDPREHELPWLPDMLREIAELFGLGVALRLSVEFGGRRLYVPKTAAPDHPVAKVIGLAPFEALCAKYGGAHVDVPLGLNGQQRQRARDIAQLNDQGRSASEIARIIQCHERTVFLHRKKRREGVGVDNKQPKLI